MTAGAAAGIRAVVWDIDGTLYDYAGTDRAAALRHFAAEGLLDRFAGPEAALLHWRAVMEEQYARYLAGELSFEGQRRERVRAFLGESGIDDATADAWFARFVAQRVAGEGLFPDVLPALAALAPGYRHGLLSNSDQAQQESTLRAIGIRHHFEVLLCSGQLGHAKPAPEAFLAACAALDLPPRAVAYVGDRPDIDAAAADAAGLYGIWLDRTGEGKALPAPRAPAGPRRITGLAELPALLGTLVRTVR